MGKQLMNQVPEAVPEPPPLTKEESLAAYEEEAIYAAKLAWIDFNELVRQGFEEEQAMTILLVWMKH